MNGDDFDKIAQNTLAFVGRGEEGPEVDGEV